MNFKNLTLKDWIVLDVWLAFSAFTAWIIYEFGYMRFIEVATSGPVNWQITIDLVIALVMVLVWMFNDAKQKGLQAWPFALVTLGLGCIGPLAYLLWRRLQGGPATTDAVATAS